jgi:hypothetical protein
MIWGSNPAEARDLTFLQIVPEWLCSPFSLLFNGHWVLFMGIKQLGSEVDHSPSSSAEIKNEWSYTSILPHGTDRDQQCR